jgi:hypothetical protein
MSKKGERGFSIELKSREQVRRLALTEADGGVLIEGFLGELKRMSLSDGVLLEVEGSDGVLRLDLNEVEAEGLLKKKPTSPEG